MIKKICSTILLSCLIFMMLASFSFAKERSDSLNILPTLLSFKNSSHILASDP